MNDYIKNNSKRCVNKCTSQKFQSYEAFTFGKTITVKAPISCNIQQICNNNQYKYLQYVQAQQDLYANMRRNPQQYPIISWVKGMNLTPGQQRQYSNNWYRQFGTSQALPVNDDWGGFYVVGSEVPYTN